MVRIRNKVKVDLITPSTTMDKSEYDTDKDGKVDISETTENLPSHTHPISEVTNLQTSLDSKEPANTNIQAHISSPHAPSNAQKNSDILKSEIEAKLTGEISSHTHAGGGGGLSQAQVLARNFLC